MPSPTSQPESSPARGYGRPAPTTHGSPGRSPRGRGSRRTAAHSADDVVSWVSAALRAGARPAQIARAARERGPLPNRALLLEILADARTGIESPLERRYHHDVERRDGLPCARLQRNELAGAGWIRADCLYEGFGVRVELDGWLGHPGGRTDADTWRDNAVLLEHLDRTLRYRWRRVAGTPCATAVQVATALRTGGAAGPPPVRAPLRRRALNPAPVSGRRPSR